VYPVVPAAGGDGNVGLWCLSLVVDRVGLRLALTAMITLGANGPLGPADRAAIVTALLTGKAIRTGMFLGLPGQHVRHINLAGDTGHFHKGHVASGI